MKIFAALGKGTRPKENESILDEVYIAMKFISYVSLVSRANERKITNAL